MSRGTGVGGVHELDVLQIIHACTIRCCRDSFRHMGVRSQAEFVEGGEEMIVARSLPRIPVAHRPGIDHLAVEDAIDVRAANRGFGGVGLARITGRRDQARRRAVHAQAAGGREIYEVFSIDCAVQMIVQISTFWHVAHKG